MSVDGKNLDTEISLTSTIFEVSYLQDISGGLALPSVLSPDDAWRWYFDIRKSPTQVSKDPIEQIFFALFHMARVSDTPTNLVWIFYCLETLFDTKVGENFRVLTERIGIFLELETKGIAIVKKKLRNLYDFRSSLVHGGQPIIHPMHDDILDKEVAEQTSKIIQGLDFGYVLIFSCLQKLARNHWTSLAFTEIMTGTKAS
ncbi:HEPN domain-containing protein [Mesorhizobium sp. WSM3626]|uniref:HEPN domain-containing protein n=1 Tax=Mesorhizobium sp. WSM3626 TaxID=1040987 RepID=UPI0012EC9956|nr:HEPN domain-containing protein [Mesorhizobium sp. WSM3626]